MGYLSNVKQKIQLNDICVHSHDRHHDHRTLSLSWHHSLLSFPHLNKDISDFEAALVVRCFKFLGLSSGIIKGHQCLDDLAVQVDVDRKLGSSWETLYTTLHCLFCKR